MASRFTTMAALVCLLSVAPWAAANDFVEEGDPESPEGITYSYEGVDILLVVDNSASMREEQSILAEQVYTLVGALAHPVEGWPYPAVEDVRVGVVSTDMGLQVDGQAGESEIDYQCGGFGDDGRLHQSAPGSILDFSGASIMCDDSAIQCPKGWVCEPRGEGPIGHCVSPDESSTIACGSSDPVVEIYDDMESEVACATMLGTDGCGIEQQLAAGIAGVGKAPNFDDPERMLVVLVISDEEDCSIASADLFESELWSNQETINLACNRPENPDHYLLSLAEIRERLVDFKGDENAVVFAGIVGVPPKPACEGLGSALFGCLDEPEMEMVPTEFEHENNVYIHYATACERSEDGVSVTAARPGRRYVELASLFGDNGYIFSICNADWFLPMQRVAKTVQRSMMIDETRKTDTPPADLEAKTLPGEDETTRAACTVATDLGAGQSHGLLGTLMNLF